jgi:hypothetical protein
VSLSRQLFSFQFFLLTYKKRVLGCPDTILTSYPRVLGCPDTLLTSYRRVLGCPDTHSESLLSCTRFRHPTLFHSHGFKIPKRVKTRKLSKPTLIVLHPTTASASGGFSLRPSGKGSKFSPTHVFSFLSFRSALPCAPFPSLRVLLLKLLAYPLPRHAFLTSCPDTHSLLSCTRFRHPTLFHSHGFKIPKRVTTRKLSKSTLIVLHPTAALASGEFSLGPGGKGSKFSPTHVFSFFSFRSALPCAPLPSLPVLSSRW